MKSVKKSTLVLITILCVLALAQTVTADISACGIVSTSGFHTLDNNISSTGHCLEITVGNVEIDCNGFSITWGGLASARSGIRRTAGSGDNLSVRDCVVIGVGTGTDDRAIYLDSMTNGTVVNNSIFLPSSISSLGIFVQFGGDNVVSNNSIYGVANIGLFVSGTDNTNTTNNRIIGSRLYVDDLLGNTPNLVAHNYIEPDSIGMQLQGSGHLIYNNTIIRVGGSALGILADNTNNNLTGNNISINGTSGSNGIYVLVSAFVINNTIRINGTSNNKGILMTGGIVDNNIVIVTGNSSNNHGVILAGSLINVTNNVIITNGTSSNYGINISSSSNSRIGNNNISARGLESYSIYFTSSSNSIFNNSVFNNSAEWINSDATSLNNSFFNTSFLTNNGSIVIPSSFILNGTQNVTRVKLNISSNLVFLNSTNLSFLNTSAQITLFNLTESDVAPTVDFEDDGTFVSCTSPQCEEISYSGGTFVFNVSSFTSYSSQEVSSGLVNVSVTKTSSPDIAVINSTLNYTITINVSGVNITNVTLIETYPLEVIFNTSQPTPNAGTNNTFSLGNMSEGTVFVVNITVFVLDSTADGTVLNNSFDLTFETSAIANTTVTVDNANATLTKSDTPDPLDISSTTLLNYTIVINITGGNASNTTLTETYPPEVSFVSAQPTPTGANNTFSLGNLSSGTGFRVNITVNASSLLANGTVINNTAILTFQNSTGGNLSLNVTANTTILYDNSGASSFALFRFSGTDSPDPVSAGSILNYTFTLDANESNGSYKIIEEYPSQVTFNTSQPTPDSGSSNQNFTIGPFSSGVFLTNISVRVNSNVANGTLINNTVRLRSHLNATERTRVRT